ncbi:MAG: hypothetical protein AABZ06_06370 [Bdellovibrionota bacterium]
MAHTYLGTLLILGLVTTAGASANDSDLSGTLNSIYEVPSTELKPDVIKTSPKDKGLSIQVLRKDHGSTTPIRGLELQIGQNIKLGITDMGGNIPLSECPSLSPSFTVTAKLKDPHVSIGNGDETYVLSFNVKCPSAVLVIFEETTTSGQAFGIWQVAKEAMLKLGSSVGLGFLRDHIEFVWPANSDYYSLGKVHISRGDHWDIVGHELGHAIYDQGDIGGFGGGQHKIDECYSAALALSEGWASFFSAWLSINLADKDARFEFMVPRRSPIRIENIPSDVCKGPTNEWRVTSFLWDLIDSHTDGENMKESFATLWHALEGSRTKSITDAVKLFKKQGIDENAMMDVWKINF